MAKYLVLLLILFSQTLANRNRRLIAELNETQVEIQGQLANLTASFSAALGEIEELKRTVLAAEAEIEELKKSQVANMTRVQDQIGGLRTRQSEAQVQTGELKKTTEVKFEEIKTSRVEIVGGLQGQLNGLSTRIDNSQPEAWPKRSFCILANGACPAGFTRASGRMIAISLYSGSSNYITPAQFGDSMIRCHGACGQYGHWTGELHLTACCK